MYAKSAKTRQKIIDVATELFKAKGFNKTGLREICKDSGINHSLIYYYFPNGKFEIAQLLHHYYKKRCLQALRRYYKIDGSMLSIMVQLRLLWREVEQDEFELTFYNESWYDISLKRSLIVELFTAAKLENLPVNIESVKRASIIRDWTWNGLYAAKSAGTLAISHEEIRDYTDLSCWSVLGLPKAYIEEKIQESKDILSTIPICGIRFFEAAP